MELRLPLEMSPAFPSPTPLYCAESPRRTEKQGGRWRRSGRWFPAPTAATAHRSAPDAGGRGHHSPVERGAACASSRVPRTHTHDARPNLPPRTSTQSSPGSLAALARQEDGRRRGLGWSYLGSGADRALKRLKTSWISWHFTDTGSITDPIFQIRGLINGGARICTQHPLAKRLPYCSRRCPKYIDRTSLKVTYGWAG